MVSKKGIKANPFFFFDEKGEKKGKKDNNIISI